MAPKWTRARLPAFLLAAALLGGCTGTRPPAPPAVPTYAGFDTWRYPGDAAMQAWRAASPYRWVGYYLPAPCHRDSSWAGRRAALEGMGWGVAVLYVGQQVFEGEPPPEEGAPGPVVCSRTLLTEAQARRDAADAVARAAAEGFPAGTIVFLNVERATALPAGMAAYYRTWAAGVLRDGRYRPGTYAHRANAEVLFALASEVHREAGRPEPPPFWVAGGSGFALDRPPAGAGLPYVLAWQGALDVERTWGGVTLTVDENVAGHPSPSSPEARPPSGS
jgi:hypothetical protein